MSKIFTPEELEQIEITVNTVIGEVLKDQVYREYADEVTYAQLCGFISKIRNNWALPDFFNDKEVIKLLATPLYDKVFYPFLQSCHEKLVFMLTPYGGLTTETDTTAIVGAYFLQSVPAVDGFDDPYRPEQCVILDKKLDECRKLVIDSPVIYTLCLINVLLRNSVLETSCNWGLLYFREAVKNKQQVNNE